MCMAAATEFISNFRLYLGENTDHIRKETGKCCLGKQYLYCDFRNKHINTVCGGKQCFALNMLVYIKNQQVLNV